MNIAIGVVAGFAAGATTALVFYKQEIKAGLAFKAYVKNVVGSAEDKAKAVIEPAITVTKQAVEKL